MEVADWSKTRQNESIAACLVVSCLSCPIVVLSYRCLVVVLARPQDKTATRQGNTTTRQYNHKARQPQDKKTTRQRRQTCLCVLSMYLTLSTSMCLFYVSYLALSWSCRLVLSYTGRTTFFYRSEC